VMGAGVAAAGATAESGFKGNAGEAGARRHGAEDDTAAPPVMLPLLQRRCCVVSNDWMSATATTAAATAREANATASGERMNGR
jgi:hypothetical protein